MHLGIPIREPSCRPWTKAEEQWVGKLPDAEVARRTGRTVNAVGEHRRDLGLAYYQTGPTRPWTPAEEAWLGMDSDEVIAKKLGRSVIGVKLRRARKGIHLRHPKNRPWTQREIKLLGTATDTEVAARLHRHPKSVQQKRAQLGIVPHGRFGTPEEDQL